MKTLVVTGGIGSGKSRVCSYLSSLGIPVYDSDSRTKALYSERPAMLDEVEKALDGSFRTYDGSFDRSALASVIFNSQDALEKLEAIVHPYVLEDFAAWRDSAPEGTPFVVFESAIFLQKPMFSHIADKVLLVDAPQELCLARAARREGMTEEKVLSRMRSQHFDRSRVDAVVVNDSDFEALYAATDAALEKLNLIKTTDKKMKTNLAKILTVSGQHGLYEYVAQARNGIIAQSLETGKRIALDSHSRVNTLYDIAIYTSEGELKLQEVFLALKEALGDAAAPTSKSSPEELKALFAKAIPNYDEDRFYVSHMKKVIDWYNNLVQFASLDFEDPEAAAEAEEGADEQ